MIQPDNQCSFFPDGIPTLLGGTGNEWLHCCVAHDASDLNLAAHLDLAQCVSDSGYTAVGALMLVGLVAFCGIYIRVRTTLSKASA